MNSELETTKRLLIAKTLMWVAAVAALGAAFSAISNVVDASSATKVVEGWRMIGFATFSGLFALLAWRPRGNGALWAMVIFNKLALSTMGVLFMLQGGVKGATDILVFDGGLTVLLIVAFVLTHWPRPRASSSQI
jgi:hypothetical protein